MNYGQLKTNVASWTNRNDLTALMDTFVLLAEDKIFNGAEDLGVRPLHVQAMLTTVSPFSNPLPANLTDIERVSWFVSGTVKKSLDFVPLRDIGEYEGEAGSPQYYSVRGNTLVYGPTFGNDVELIYYARPAAMVLDADQNFLLAAAPTVYLYGCLLEAAGYLQDEAGVARYGAAFRNAMRSYQNQDDQMATSGATLRVRSDARIKP